VTFAKMNICPRCNLQQNGIYKCQYCGYDLNKYYKKPTNIIRKWLKDIIGGLKKNKIISNNKKSKAHSINNTGKAFKRTNNGGNRSGPDRRKYKYTTYFPERRSGVNRRK
jgi:primosomal protein N'